MSPPVLPNVVDVSDDAEPTEKQPTRPTTPEPVPLSSPDAANEQQPGNGAEESAAGPAPPAVSVEKAADSRPAAKAADEAGDKAKGTLPAINIEAHTPITDGRFTMPEKTSSKGSADMLQASYCISQGAAL